MRLPTRSGPSGKYGDTLNYLDPRLLVFEGQDEGTYLNDLYIFDGSGFPENHSDPTADWEFWLPNDAYPERPLARADHTMVSWDDKLYLSSPGECRGGHAAAVVDGVMHIFGGRNSECFDLGD